MPVAQPPSLETLTKSLQHHIDNLQKQANELSVFKNVHMEFSNFWAADKCRTEESVILKNIAELKLILANNKAADSSGPVDL